MSVSPTKRSSAPEAFVQALPATTLLHASPPASSLVGCPIRRGLCAIGATLISSVASADSLHTSVRLMARCAWQEEQTVLKQSLRTAVLGASTGAERPLRDSATQTTQTTQAGAPDSPHRAAAESAQASAAPEAISAMRAQPALQVMQCRRTAASASHNCSLMCPHTVRAPAFGMPEDV